MKILRMPAILLLFSIHCAMMCNDYDVWSKIWDKGSINNAHLSRLFSHQGLHERGHTVFFGMKEIDGDSSS